MSVIVFGSLNTDLCYQVTELPRPGETMHALNFEVFNGGKGANQAIAAARSGADTAMIGSIGRDAYGQSHVDSMDKEGINTSYINHSSKPTGIANIYIDQHGENNIVLNAGANGDTSVDQIEKYPLSAEDIVVVQMEVNHEDIAKALKVAKSKGAQTLLNLAPAPENFVDGLFDNIDYLVVNEIEAEQVYNHIKGDRPSNSSHENMACAIAEILETNCIVTLGGSGVYACGKDAQTYTAKPLKLSPEEIVDTTGAGDAFTGAFTSAIHKGKQLNDALQYAAVAGSLACLKLGAQSSYPTEAEILECLGKQAAA